MTRAAAVALVLVLAGTHHAGRGGRPGHPDFPVRADTAVTAAESAGLTPPAGRWS